VLVLSNEQQVHEVSESGRFTAAVRSSESVQLLCNQSLQRDQQQAVGVEPGEGSGCEADAASNDGALHGLLLDGVDPRITGGLRVWAEGLGNRRPLDQVRAPIHAAMSL